MFEPLLVKAFLAGIVSACSMPLGSLTALYWRPNNQIVSFLMAFGGGALLAALVIDLVGSATEKGHLLELIVGAIAGSLLFTAANRAINHSGGFLRKPSTTLVHLTQKESRQFAEHRSRVKRIDLFRDLEQSDRQKLAQYLLVDYHPLGTVIYQQGDPSESLYIIEKGSVTLHAPGSKAQLPTRLSANDTFGMMAFLTGCPHQTVAIATTALKLNILPRSDFESLLQSSPSLVRNTASFLQSEAVAEYLQKRHGLGLARVREWVGSSVQSLVRESAIPPAVEVTHKPDEFIDMAHRVRRLPIFKHLPAEDLQKIADRLIYLQRDDGHIFFQPQEASDRLYIIHMGEVEIVYPTHYQKPPKVLIAGDVFGELSFVTSATHTVTAIAKTDVSVWVLRKQFFDEILLQSRILEDNVREFLGQTKLKNYLQTRQNFEPAKAGEWIQSAMATMNAGHLIPSVAAMTNAVEEHKNAPMAIWLGLLIDAIPEALTIGAHLVTSPLSSSLLAGLFIANYPEAFSSSRGMRQQGFSLFRIFLMWSSIMLITGILAAVGAVVFTDVPDALVSLLGSIAAGAMLTVISETMLPEAYAMGGSVVGLSTVMGFLIVISIVHLAPH
ncbi:cyclic nucleotide-binding domain protein [Rubidibacter lacunae KORDI 51-2]|uniref:Cyclic nucleotide-binding domain protein n=1 Tax=Rubidibacter lacunae KORDI 51-2 TaxID=582515 RepID=U5DE87_9CHRO|nr:cyclic nucleotide-binding domain-containing protein [Rubidibacter lacunae]ERN42828.1 cyclic nucleotide-binding domain protein [Rubidibacter lacunae KORDI 51-2]